MILGETVHLSPAVGEGLTPCCHRPPFELPPGDRLTKDADAVTCRPELHDRLAVTEEDLPASSDEDDAYPGPFGPHPGRPPRWDWEPATAGGQTMADLSLDEWVGQALGAASMCWERVGLAGEFQSTRCKWILDGLMAHLNRVIDGVAAGTAKATAPAEPLLGLATTRDMLREIEVRAAIGRLDDEWRPFAPALLRLEQIASGLQAGLPDEVLDYRTVRS